MAVRRDLDHRNAAINRSMEEIMRKNLSSFITAWGFCAGLALPMCALAQGNYAHNLTAKHHQYQLIDLGTLGGPNNYLSGPATQILNNRGTVAAHANTATPNPNANCAIPFNANSNGGDCYVERPAL